MQGVVEASSLSMLLQGSSKIWFQELSPSIFCSPDRGRLTAFLILISLGHLPSENLFLLFVFAQRELAGLLRGSPFLFLLLQEQKKSWRGIRYKMFVKYSSDPLMRFFSLLPPNMKKFSLAVILLGNFFLLSDECPTCTGKNFFIKFL